MNHLFITQDPDIARFVDACGVERIFIDLEWMGKAQRQAGRDTVLSNHQVENIRAVRETVSRALVLVRTNPIHGGIGDEIEACLDQGAQLLMLPMCRTAMDVDRFCRFVRGRAAVVPLVETVLGARNLVDIVHVDGVREIHIGLNDLHLEMGKRFLFELLADGTVERMAATCLSAGMPFGIGGVSTVGTGSIPGEMVLGEHARLGSSSVILSRSFHQRAENLADLQRKVDFVKELAALRAAHAEKLRRTSMQVEQDRVAFVEQVGRVLVELERRAAAA